MKLKSEIKEEKNIRIHTVIFSGHKRRGRIGVDTMTTGKKNEE